MKTYILWAFVAVLLLNAGPALCQDNDDDKFAQPQIDVISDVEPVEVPSPKTPKEKSQKRHPEDRAPASEQTPSGVDTASPVLHEVDKSEASDVEPSQAGKKPRRKQSTEESDSGRDTASVPVVEISDSEKPAPVEPALQEQVEQLEIKPEQVEVKPEPVEIKPEQPQEQVPPQPEPVVEPPKPVEVQKEAPKNPQGPKGQTGPAKAPVKEQPAQPAQAQPVPQVQEEKPVVPEEPIIEEPIIEEPIFEEPIFEEPVEPVEIPQEVPQAKPAPVNPQVEVVQPQKVQEKVPVSAPEPQKQTPPASNIPSQPTIQEVPKPEVPPVKPADVKPALVKEESGKGKKDKTPVRTEPEVDEEQYLNLYENEGNDYLDKYTVYSDTFYAHVEKFVKEAVVPIYRHIRANPELSLGFSTLVLIYFINLFFRLVGRLFKRKPKFVYNKEEALSHADINNNFKKFVAELDSLKKQIDKKGGVATQASGETGSTASIPQNMQNEISYIAQNLSKNEELLNKITKDRKQLDSFLFEFQKEVVESHKAIWNELYQLRKVFSQTKGVASLKPRESKDLDDTKSLSSNPETSDTRRRDETREHAKKGTEPRSRSAAAPEANALKSRNPLPKEKKPVQVVQAAETEKPVASLNGNGPEVHTPAQVQKEEEPEVKPHATQTPFGKPEVTEEAQPEVQINTNTDKIPSQNPFATSTQQNATSTITPNVNIPGKGIPFGVKGRPPVVKQPVIQTTFPLGNEPPAVNSGAKVDSIPELNSGLKGTPHHPAQSQIETQQEKPEEKSTVPETDQAQEEAKAAERLSGADEMLAGGDEEGNDANTGSKGFIPPMRGPGPMGMGGPPGQRKPVIPTNKALPVPGRKPGLPGANVFKGPPGNIPRAAVPTQIKQPQGQVQDSASKTGTAV